jgi:uncharacterized membrane protein
MRSQKLDALRGIAVIWMVIFHAHYILLHVFEYTSIDFPNLFWYILGRVVAVVFIFVAGISFWLFVFNKDVKVIYKHFFKRACILSIIAFMITYITYIWFYEQRISFGIIHFFSLSSIVSLGFIKFWRWNVIIGMIIITLQFLIDNISVNTNILLPIGLVNRDFFSADYYPLIPWLGYFLIWYGVISFFDERGRDYILFRGYSWLLELPAYLWRYALVIYIAHTPLIYMLYKILL